MGPDRARMIAQFVGRIPPPDKRGLAEDDPGWKPKSMGNGKGQLRKFAPAPAPVHKGPYWPGLQQKNTRA